jgi:hypothetical protein
MANDNEKRPRWTSKVADSEKKGDLGQGAFETFVGLKSLPEMVAYVISLFMPFGDSFTKRMVATSLLGICVFGAKFVNLRDSCTNFVNANDVCSVAIKDRIQLDADVSEDLGGGRIKFDSVLMVDRLIMKQKVFDLISTKSSITPEELAWADSKTILRNEDGTLSPNQVIFRYSKASGGVFGYAEVTPGNFDDAVSRVREVIEESRKHGALEVSYPLQRT